MKAIYTAEYEYHYYWVKFRGRVVIAEARTEPDSTRVFYRIPGEVLTQREEDIQILDFIKDYDENIS